MAGMAGKMAAFAGALGIGALGTGLFASSGSVDETAVATSSCSKRFRTFASSVENGRQYMSFDDFVVSLCRGKKPESAENAAAAASRAMSDDLRSLFRLFDDNGDNQLSYSEFCVLYTILSTPAAHFRTAFSMFDHDGNGAVDSKEFVQLVTAMSADPTAKLDFGANNGLMKHFFGPDRKRVLPYSEFEKAVKQLRGELLKTEFEMAKGKGKGLSVGQVRRLIYHKADAEMAANAAAGADAPPADDTNDDVARTKFKKGKKGVKNVTPKTPAVNKGPVVTQQDYVTLLRVLQAAPEWLRALEIYQEAHGGSEAASVCNRPAFQRALSAVGQDLSPRQSELLFRVFDTDDSGTLEPEELTDIVAARQSFFSKYKPDFLEPKRNGVQAFVHCMQQK